MPAVRSAAGPISVPACDAPISMGTPSSAIRCWLAVVSDIGRKPQIRRRGYLVRRSSRSEGGYLRLEVRDLRRGCQQPSARGPQFPILVAIALVENLGVGDAEHAGGIFRFQIGRIGMEIGRQRHRAERNQFPPGVEIRAKNASDIDINDSASILRGTRSPIQSFEKVSTAPDPPRFGSPSTKRKSYCLTQGAAIGG